MSLLTPSTPGVVAAKQATASIPIVFATATDPVGSGLVTSLARPGGNVTGLSIQSPDIAGKRLALLREVAPKLRRVAFIGNIDNPFVLRELREVQAAGSALGLEVATSEIRRPQDIVPAFEALKHRADAVYVASETLTDANRLHINILAAGARLPTMWAAGGRRCRRPHVLRAELPGLYPSRRRLCRQDPRGREAGDIPVEQPTKFDLVINLRTAKALGLEVPGTCRPRRRGDRIGMPFAAMR